MAEQFISIGSQVAAATITTIGLTAGVSGDVSTLVGQVFKKGDVPNGASLMTDTPGASLWAIPLVRWSDGSLKHSALIIRKTLVANTRADITIKTGTATPGNSLSANHIIAVNPQASVVLSGFGTVDLSSVINTPYRTLYSNPGIVECHYRSNVGSDPDLFVVWHVRLRIDGRVEINSIVYNGRLGTNPSSKTYTATVTVGGNVVYTGTKTHRAFQRWNAIGWIGGDPAVIPKHDSQYWTDSKVFPNYSHRNPTQVALNNLQQVYDPLNIGIWPNDTSGTGPGVHIGLEPLPSALYCASAPPQAFKSMIAGSRSFGGYSLFRPSATNDRIPYPALHPTATISAGGGGTFLVGNGQYTWDSAHAPNAGLCPYAATADYFHLETLAYQAMAFYLCMYSTEGGPGNARVNRDFQTRACGWMTNQVGMLCAIAPVLIADAHDAAMINSFKAWLTNQELTWANGLDVPGMSTLGVIYESALGNWDGDGTIPIWMDDFWGSSNGRVYDAEYTTDMTHLIRVRDRMYKLITERLGPTGAGNYHFSRAAQYGIRVHPTSIGVVFGVDETELFDNMGQVWDLTMGSSNAETTNVLQGSSGSLPTIPDGYWMNLHPHIAYAVDHNAPNAAAANARLTGATNYAGLMASGLDNFPIFAIKPRTTTDAAYIPSMADGVWVDLSGDTPDLGLPATPIGTRYADDIDPDPGRTAPYDGNSGFGATMFAWNSGIYVPTLGLLGSLVFFGGGHSDYYGNVIYRFDLYTRRWSIVRQPSLAGPFNIGAALNNGQYIDGTPSPAHYYGYLGYYPVTDSLIVLKSISNVNAPDPGDAGLAIPQMYSFPNNTWTRGPQAPVGFRSPSGGAACYDTIRKKFWSMEFDQGDFGLFDPAGNNGDGTFGNWQIFDASGTYNIYSTLAHDPLNDAIIILDAVGQAYRKDPNNMTAARVPFTISGLSSFSGQSGFDWSPLQAGFIFHQSDTGNVYRIRTTNNWASGIATLVSSNNNGKSFTVTNGFFGKTRSVDIAGRTVQYCATNVNAPIHAMRIP